MSHADRPRAFAEIVREQLLERRARLSPPLSPAQRAEREAREQQDLAEREDGDGDAT